MPATGGTGASPSRDLPRFRVRPKACGFRAVIDLTKLNELLDDLEIERAELSRFPGLRWMNPLR